MAARRPVYLIALADLGDSEQFYVTERPELFAWLDNSEDTPPDSFFADAWTHADEDYQGAAFAGYKAQRRAQIERLEREGLYLSSGSYKNDKAQHLATLSCRPVQAGTIGELLSWLAREGYEIADEFHGLWY